MVAKSLDLKLARIHADPQRCKDFILADAKDADMALAIGAPGKSPEAHSAELQFRTLQQYRDQIVQVVEQQLVDIMLMSGSTSEVLTIQRRLFDTSPVTPAARANDTSDIHILRGGRSAAQPSLPFRTATLDHLQCGHLDCKPEERRLGVDLGLYSITFSNDPVQDRENLEEYKAFRHEAERKGFRHFLELFDPNVAGQVAPEQIPAFINDVIVRTLGGVTSKGRPVFLKMVYHGPQWMEELVHYDPHLVVGILGGSAGTTYDAFKLLSEAKKYGARVALFGRKINNAENQLAFVKFLRLIADDQINAEEAVRAYHGTLQTLGIRPHRSLKDDMQLQTGVMNYAGNGTAVSLPTPQAAPPVPAAAAPVACQCHNHAHPAPSANGKAKEPVAATNGKAKESVAATNGKATEPDFATMTTAQKLAWHKARWDRILS